MSTTAAQVFDKAMALMDAIDESGATQNDDTIDYQNKALYIINMLQAELYRYSDSYTAAVGTRPVPAEITAYTDTVHTDDFLARVIMPYGLAYHLLAADGDGTMADIYQQRYQSLLAASAGAIPSETENIGNIYGGIEYRNGDC